MITVILSHNSGFNQLVSVVCNFPLLSVFMGRFKFTSGYVLLQHITHAAL